MTDTECCKYRVDMFMPDFSSFSPGKERLRVTGRPLSRTAIPCRPQQIAHLQNPQWILLTENSNVQCQSGRSVPPRRCICSKPPTDALSPGRRFLTGNPTVSLQRVLPFMNALISLLGWNWIVSRDHIGLKIVTDLPRHTSVHLKQDDTQQINCLEENWGNIWSSECHLPVAILF